MLVSVVMEGDDFFDYFRNKDLSKVKKFDYKKAKKVDASQTSFSSSKHTGSREVRGVDAISDDQLHKLKTDDFRQTFLLNGKSDISCNSPCTHVSTITMNKSQKSTIQCKQKDETCTRIFPVKEFNNLVQHDGKIKDALSNGTLNSLSQNSSKKCTFKHETKKATPTSTFDSPFKNYKLDNSLDVLYKSTFKDVTTLKVPLNKSNSYFSSSPDLNISKYFSYETNYQNLKTNKLCPLKKRLQSKLIESSTENSTKIEKFNKVSDLNGIENSPVATQKKFVFKKKSSQSSVVLNHGLDLNDILGGCKEYSDDLFSPNKKMKDQKSSPSAVALNHNLDLDDVLGGPKESTNNLFTLNKTTEDNSTVTSMPTLDITEADYMDDEEFEKRFGSLSEQTPIDGSSTSKLIKEPSNYQNTDELLNGISNINWNDNLFEEEEGFKDRNDNSDEFRGYYDHSEVMMEVLQQKFGLNGFRPYQREIINASLTQQDCIVLMPTGGGKSLCYQLPATLMPGVTIVISPLRALISDQVDKLKALDIAAAHLCSDVSKSESEHIYLKLSMREPAIKLLYLTPEKINASRSVIDILHHLYQRGKLARFVIDEVHCLSQWGHDFRPDYKELSLLRKNYPEVPIICLTATATRQVENDVINILDLKNVKRFIRSFNRSNIKYKVINKVGNAISDIINLIKSKFVKKSGIVYCLSRNDCEELADQFNKLGVKAKPYHAGMADKVREAIQREWMQDRFHVIVATIAFGMGIDKPDVRFVVHNSVPKSVEAFYQESGRAGRDGEVSYSYLFYSYRDARRLQKLVRMNRHVTQKTLEAHEENLKQMVSFAENVVDCRRYLLLLHLGENFDRRKCIRNKATTCDNCENIDKYKSQDFTKEAKELCTIVKDLSQNENVTMVHVADVYRGAKRKKILERHHNEHPFYGRGASINQTDIQRILKELILKDALQEFHTYTGEFPVVYIKPSPKLYQFLNSNYQLTISVSTEKIQKKKELVISTTNVKGSASTEVVRHSIQKQNTARLQAARKLQLAQIRVQCHEELLEECRRLAMERNLTLSSIMNLSAIKFMSDHLPSTKDEMLKIQHVTVANYNKYGDCFLKITQKFREKHDAIQPLSERSRPDPEERLCSDEEESQFRLSGSGNSVSNAKSGGVKRKATWSGSRNGNKKKKYSHTKKRKGKGAFSKGKSVSNSEWKGKRKKAGAGGGLGLMPLHIK